MGNRKWTYGGCIHFNGTDMLTNLYLEKLGWVWDMEEMDYVTDDEDVFNYTVDIDCYLGDLYFVMDEDEIVSKVLAACNYNDEEELNKEILVQLNAYIEQELPELSGNIKEDVRQVFSQSMVYEYIKSKADEQIVNINLADKINKGILNTEWKESKSEFVDIIRRGLGVTTLILQKEDNTDWVLPIVEQRIRKGLFKNGYTPIQIESIMDRVGGDLEELVREGRLVNKDSGLELRLLILPKGLNGFDEDDRVKILVDNTYQYLKTNNIVY